MQTMLTKPRISFFNKQQLSGKIISLNRKTFRIGSKVGVMPLSNGEVKHGYELIDPKFITTRA